MSTTVGIEFVGGPLDGQQRHIPVDEEGIPQAAIRVARVAPPGWLPGWYTTDIAYAEVVYERHPSPRSHGPLWLYILEGLDL